MSNLGSTELLIILLILVMLFGARKLPDLARGTGKALRIFKAETKNLGDDDDRDDSDDYRSGEQGQITGTRSQPEAADPSSSQTQHRGSSLPHTHTEK